MERLLARLERRLGRFAIPHLPMILVAGTAIAYVMRQFRPDLADRLELDWAAVAHGEVWRLVTFLFLTSRTNPIFFVLQLMFSWMVLNALVEHWGAFRLTVFWLMGALGAVAVAWFVGVGNNSALNLSLFLAFATLFPDTQLYLIVIPVRAKWLGLVAAAFYAYSIFPFSVPTVVATAVAMSNYMLFFAGHWVHIARNRNVQVRQAARRADLGAAVEAPADRACALCGKTQSSGADIRVCSCERCGGPRNLCVEHARSH